MSAVQGLNATSSTSQPNLGFNGYFWKFPSGVFVALTSVREQKSDQLLSYKVSTVQNHQAPNTSHGKSLNQH